MVGVTPIIIGYVPYGVKWVNLKYTIKEFLEKLLEIVKGKIVIKQNEILIVINDIISITLIDTININDDKQRVMFKFNFNNVGSLSP